MNRLISKITSGVSRSIQEYYYSIFPDKEWLGSLEEIPGELSIEPVNICNANCVFCAYQYQKRPKQRMSEAIFKRAISSYADIGGGNLYWAVVVGDPLLDTDCVNRIQYARSFSCIKRIEIITNCINLHKVGAKELLTSGANVITVSTTGFDAEMYRRVYRTGHYEQMKENLLDLLRTNQVLGRPVKIDIELRIDKSIKNILQQPEFTEVKELADSIDANYYYDNWVGKIKGSDLTGNMKMRPGPFAAIKKKVPCAQLWRGIGVLVDGTVTACSCRDLNGDSDLVLGKIQERSLNEMFRSDYLNRLREDWISKGKIPYLCRNCLFYNPYTYLMLREAKKRHMEMFPLTKSWSDEFGYSRIFAERDSS